MSKRQDSMKWVHPTGCVPESVLLVALGPTKHDLLEATTAHEPPDDIMGCGEVWGVNAGCNHLAGRVAYDVLFVMDYLDGERRRLPRYGEHLRDWSRRFGGQIITSEAGGWAGHAGVHEYPLRWVLERTGGDAYFHNSVPYILAYALAIGVQRMTIYGADYSHESSKRREDDRPNAEYWLGFCQAKGMQFSLPPTTTLLNANRRGWFYGYRDQPEF